MALFILGISYKTASIDMRGKVAFSLDKLPKALSSLAQQPLIQGAVLLSTCNRTELYISAESVVGLKEKLIIWLKTHHDLEQTKVQKNWFYWYQEDEAVRHLMRVTSGLDSQMLGESQILGQTKKAFSVSQQQKFLSLELQKMFQKAFSTAKRVRTETQIGNNTVSIAFASCMLARQFFDSLNNLTVLLVGAGETIQLVAQHLKKHQPGKIIIANRTYTKALHLAKEIGATPISLNEIETYLHEVDIIISSTASSQLIITKEMVQNILPRKQQKSILFIDIAVPRDIEYAIQHLPNCYVYSVDDLQSIIQQNLLQRQLAAGNAEKIVAEECNNFMSWLRTQIAKEVVLDYRTQAENIKNNIECHALSALKQGGDAEVIIRKLAHRLTNKLIHTPTKSLKNAASKGDLAQLQLLRDSLLD